MSDRTPLDRADNPVTLEDWRDRCEFLERELSNFRRNASARAEEIARAEVSSLGSQLKQAQEDLASQVNCTAQLESNIRFLHERLGFVRANACDAHKNMLEISTGPCPFCRANAAESRLQAVTEALQSSDSMLSLLRHRQEATIKWGTPGLPEMREVDAVIGKSREALAPPTEPSKETEPPEEECPKCGGIHFRGKLSKPLKID